MKLQCLVIDDDPMICDLIKHFCTKIPEVHYCIVSGTGKDGLQVLSSQEINLIFLDYHLPDMKGDYLLEIKESMVPVIMITSEGDFAAKSYEYDDVVDFLVKPLSFERFEKAIHRVLQQKNDPVNQVLSPSAEISDYLFIKDGSKRVKIVWEELLYLKSEGNYIAFVTKDKTTLSLMTAKEIEDKLPANFLRVHRSYIVNMNKVESLSPEEIYIGKLNIPISQKHKKEVMEYIGEKDV